MTYLVRGDRKHWSNVFVLAMAFLDLFIGSFVLPVRFLAAYVNPLTSKLCTALSIGEAWAMASIIYAIVFMVYIRLYNLKQPTKLIYRRYLILLLFISWIAFFLFYGIPFIINSADYLLISTTRNHTGYCATYSTSIVHPFWMNCIEFGMIYIVPLSLIFIGLICLIYYSRQAKPKGLDLIQRKSYLERKQMTRHVLILSSTFLLLWLPWIILRIISIWSNTNSIQHALQITYYILIFKCLIFPILYASTNASFRGSFAIYRHKRITMNNRVWAIDRYD